MSATEPLPQKKKLSLFEEFLKTQEPKGQEDAALSEALKSAVTPEELELAKSPAMPSGSRPELINPLEGVDDPNLIDKDDPYTMGSLAEDVAAPFIGATRGLIGGISQVPNAINALGQWMWQQAGSEPVTDLLADWAPKGVAKGWKDFTKEKAGVFRHAQEIYPTAADWMDHAATYINSRTFEEQKAARLAWEKRISGVGKAALMSSEAAGGLLDMFVGFSGKGIQIASAEISKMISKKLANPAKFEKYTNYASTIVAFAGYGGVMEAGQSGVGLEDKEIASAALEAALFTPVFLLAGKFGHKTAEVLAKQHRLLAASGRAVVEGAALEFLPAAQKVLLNEAGLRDYDIKTVGGVLGAGWEHLVVLPREMDTIRDDPNLSDDEKLAAIQKLGPRLEAAQEHYANSWTHYVGNMIALGGHGALHPSAIALARRTAEHRAYEKAAIEGDALNRAIPRELHEPVAKLALDGGWQMDSVKKGVVKLQKKGWKPVEITEAKDAPVKETEPGEKSKVEEYIDKKRKAAFEDLEKGIQKKEPEPQEIASIKVAGATYRGEKAQEVLARLLIKSAVANTRSRQLLRIDGVMETGIPGVYRIDTDNHQGALTIGEDGRQVLFRSDATNHWTKIDPKKAFGGQPLPDPVATEAEVEMASYWMNAVREGAKDPAAAEQINAIRDWMATAGAKERGLLDEVMAVLHSEEFFEHTKTDPDAAIDKISELIGGGDADQTIGKLAQETQEQIDAQKERINTREREQGEEGDLQVDKDEPEGGKAEKGAGKGAAEEVDSPEIQAARTKHEAAKAKLEAIGEEPYKPSSEKKFFGKKGKEAADPEHVAQWEAMTKTYRSWNRKYLKLSKERVKVSNELFRLEQAQTDPHAAPVGAESGGRGFPTGTKRKQEDVESARVSTMQKETTTSERVRKRDIIKAAQDVANVVVRHGGHGKKHKGKAGWFKYLEGLVENKYENDPEITFHEIGHGIDYVQLAEGGKKAGSQKLSPAIQRELVELGKDLYGGTLPKGASYTREGFAEWTARTIMDGPDADRVIITGWKGGEGPADKSVWEGKKWTRMQWAQLKLDDIAGWNAELGMPITEIVNRPLAPETTAWVKKNYPELYDGILKLRKLYQTEVTQGAHGRMEQASIDMATVGSRNKWAKLKDSFAERKWVDRAQPLKALRDSIRRAGGVDAKELPPDADPYQLFTAYSYKSPAVAHMMMTQGMVNIRYDSEGKASSLTSVLEPIRKDMKEFVHWIQAAKDVDLMGRNDRMLDHYHEEIEAFKEEILSLKDYSSGMDAQEKAAEGITKQIAAAKRGIKKTTKQIEDIENKVVNHNKRGMSILPLEDTQYIVNELKKRDPAKYTKFKDALDGLTEWNRGLLYYVVDSGGLSRELADFLVMLDPIYIPLEKYDPVTQAQRDAQAGGQPKGGKGKIQRLSGTSRKEVINPVEIMMVNAQRMVSWAHKAQIQRALVKMMKDSPESGRWIREVNEKKVPIHFKLWEIKDALIKYGIDLDEANMGQAFTIFNAQPRDDMAKNQIVVWENNKPKVYEILLDNPEVFSLIMEMDKLPANVAMRAMAIPARMVRLGATTLSPGFIMFNNVIKDALDATVYSKGKWTPGRLLDPVRGLIKSVKNDADAQKRNAMGGEMTGLIGQDRQTTRKLEEYMNVTRKEKGMYFLKHPIYELLAKFRDAVGHSEAANRLMEFSRVLPNAEGKWGKGSLSALIEAFNASQDITVNFTRMGSVVQMMNTIMPFYAASIGGVNKMYREARYNTKQFLTRAGTAFFTAKMIEYMLNKDETWYKELTTYEKMYFLRPTEGFRLPLGHVGNIMGGFPVTMIEGIMEGDDQRKREAVTRVVQDLFPWAPTPGFADGWTKWNIEGYMARMVDKFPTAAKAPAAMAMNYDPWRQREIFPTYLKLEKKDEYHQFTTGVARLIGKAIPMSPAKVEYLLAALTGGTSTRIFRGMDVVMTGKGVKYYEIPILSSMFTQDSLRSYSIDKAYKREGELTRKLGSLKLTNKDASLSPREHWELKDLRMMKRDMTEVRRAVGAGTMSFAKARAVMIRLGREAVNRYKK